MNIKNKCKITLKKAYRGLFSKREKTVQHTQNVTHMLTESGFKPCVIKW